MLCYAMLCFAAEFSSYADYVDTLMLVPCMDILATLCRKCSG
jgi:hypothetical protein